MLLHHRDLTLQESDTVGAAIEHYRSRPGLGCSDCLILETARIASHLSPGTFDRNLSKLDGAERIAKSPCLTRALTPCLAGKRPAVPTAGVLGHARELLDHRTGIENAVDYGAGGAELFFGC
jgi:hypothetical protein